MFQSGALVPTRNFGADSLRTRGMHWQPMFPPIFNKAARKNKQMRWITILLSRSY